MGLLDLNGKDTTIDIKYLKKQIPIVEYVGELKNLYQEGDEIWYYDCISFLSGVTANILLRNNKFVTWEMKF